MIDIGTISIINDCFKMVAFSNALGLNYKKLIKVSKG
jgi:hypothetical protein